MIRAVLLVLALAVAWAAAPIETARLEGLPAPVPVSASAPLDAPAAPVSLDA